MHFLPISQNDHVTLCAGAMHLSLARLVNKLITQLETETETETEIESLYMWITDTLLL